ncbi:bifunctional UDP-3-O-[3-hydroxymyristoyl] N-acetylglucosamine deacetylase/3-hydroxyacyl-ACP dehydratase [uncultured Rikenella sp.]|uniref:bifunctional UDP-3-O-[3-hydroxymyristoyl] N-acetylglucosamine deacetylase/3-hydroxyacyl-ACP dehydratase n=1 Tax=uncultured Rikenella sp. TaxID=368003 RepID=UPI002617DD57|nr:bifunctional UDP-3-O-[3-hydroxymyristoyl] N-acetylglucosamine deacetylase/3-hydroxyacyl-ACP dehydratase [uncultured Rikenella sp.]
MTEKQQTLGAAATFSGKGLHTGATVNLTIQPAEAGHGIKFCRTDLEGRPVIEAVADNVFQTSRSTLLKKGEATVSTIEHLMAALWGCGVDNALVEVDGGEVPIADGSAMPWVRLIRQAGIVPQDAPRKYYEISEKTVLALDNGREIVAYPDDVFSVTANVDFDSHVVGKQYAVFSVGTDGGDDFAAAVAPSRTFVFLHEIEPLIQNNMIRGGDLDNAIVIVEQPVSADKAAQIGKLFGREGVAADRQGYLNNLELHFDNEIARHKLLDLLGDLALVGMRIKGRILATRPGHAINTEFAKLLRKQIKRDADRPTFKYDPNAEPIYDINRIKATLPHRPPFLLVDKIIHLTDTEVVGIKNVTMNEPFFVGHFPDEPVMPGVLQVEAMAQCGGILALSTVPDPENYSTYFMTIDGVKYRHKVVPGDTLQFELRLSEPIRRGIVKMDARAYIGNTLATEAKLMALITKNK